MKDTAPRMRNAPRRERRGTRASAQAADGGLLMSYGTLRSSTPFRAAPPLYLAESIGLNANPIASAAMTAADTRIAHPSRLETGADGSCFQARMRTQTAVQCLAICARSGAADRYQRCKPAAKTRTRRLSQRRSVHARPIVEHVVSGTWMWRGRRSTSGGSRRSCRPGRYRRCA